MTKGQHHTVETRARISAKKIGIQFTQTHNQNISRALMGRAKSPSHKKAIADGVRLAHLIQKGTPQPNWPPLGNMGLSTTSIKDERSWEIHRTGRVLVGTRQGAFVVKVAENDDPEAVFTDRMLILTQSEAHQLLAGLNRAFQK